MTAKEKAEELLAKFFAVDFEEGEAKVFANIVCDEVMAAFDHVDSLDNATHHNFWEEVKAELNKL